MAREAGRGGGWEGKSGRGRLGGAGWEGQAGRERPLLYARCKARCLRRHRGGEHEGLPVPALFEVDEDVLALGLEVGRGHRLEHRLNLARAQGRGALMTLLTWLYGAARAHGSAAAMVIARPVLGLGGYG